MTKDRLHTIAFLALLGAVSLVLFFVFKPFLQLLALAAVIAILLEWPYQKLRRSFNGNTGLAAGSIVLLFIVFILAPLFFLGTEIFLEAQALYVQTPEAGAHYLQTVQDSITHFIQHTYPSFTFNASQYVGTVLSFISSNLAALVSGTALIVFETFLMLLALFYFLRDGKSLLHSAMDASPFGKKETEEIAASMRATITTVVRGTLLVAVIRWVCIGVAFSLFGIPNALLWGSVGGIIGAIPGLGALLVFVPAALYLYLAGNIVGALGVAISGLLVIVLIDNLLTPYFFGKGLEVPQLFVLFSVLGGIIFFGPVGFILGPLALSLFVSLLKIYSKKEGILE
jgi:predicted PurR-regulated permease PerM